MKALAYAGFLLTLLIFAIALTGCARPPERIVPSSLLTCADQPRSPADDPTATQRDVANYIVDLAAAGADCRSNLGSVRRILTEPETTQ